MKIILPIVIWVWVFILLFHGCEKFVGYNYDADPLPRVAIITGNITNTFTGEPIIYAQIQVGTQQTKTDQYGQYLMYYAFESDEDRNKPVKLVFSAPNYYSSSYSHIIYPGNNQFDTQLTYAAPIIQKTAFVQIDSVDTVTVCQVLVFDYQGADDIASATASFVYMHIAQNTTFLVEKEMEFVERYSDQASFYQVVYQPWPVKIYSFENKCTVVATDSEGYTDGVSLKIDAQNPDTLLFPWR